VTFTSGLFYLKIKIMNVTKKQEVIPIEFTNATTDPLVDARLLHLKLGVDTKFSMWIERRIHEYGFKKNEDYFPNLGKSITKPKKEYHLTLDMAKELAMLERSAGGRSLRKYFISAEKELRSKRLYAGVASLTEISRKVRPQNINGRKMFELREVREALGYSTKSSTGNVHRQFPGLIVVLNHRAFVSEEYVRVMMALAKVRAVKAEAKEAKPVLPAHFGEPLTLFPISKGGEA
jgi:phage anti-repressor protein